MRPFITLKPLEQRIKGEGLYIDSVPLSDILDLKVSPIYVTSLNSISQRLNYYKSALQKHFSNNCSCKQYLFDGCFNTICCITHRCSIQPISSSRYSRKTKSFGCLKIPHPADVFDKFLFLAFVLLTVDLYPSAGLGERIVPSNG